MVKKLGRNDPCWCGSSKKYKKCHAEFDDKLESYRLQGHIVPPREIIKNPAQIAGIRASGKINTAILDYITDHIKIGISTEEIDQLVYQKTLELGGHPHPNTGAIRKASVLLSMTKSATAYRHRK